MPETPERAAQRVRLHEICQVSELLASSSNDARQLVNRLCNLFCEELVDEGSHVLRLAGLLCLEYGQPELFELLFREALEGCKVNVGDELRFLELPPGRLVRQLFVAPPSLN